MMVAFPADGLTVNSRLTLNFPLLSLRTCAVLVLLSQLLGGAVITCADEFDTVIQPLLKKHCFKCHAGDEVNGDVDFSSIKATTVGDRLELWESVVELVDLGLMPPEDETRLTADEKKSLHTWYQQLLDAVEPHPGVFRPRRLSAHEYRNTLHSIFGFPMEVAIVEAEQTVTERSLVMKLLPTDPPGDSGFTNDTTGNPLTTVIWDQYSYLVDFGLEQLFSQRRDALVPYTGELKGDHLTETQAKKLIRAITRRAYRRPVDGDDLAKPLSAIDGRSGADLESVLRREIKAILMSPSFIYRGLRMEIPRDVQQPVDAFELAERLSYFLWADMPDEQLMRLAEDGTLKEPGVMHAQIDRMLVDPKARSLAEDLGVEWFSLNEIEKVSNNPPVADALRRQPIDFLNYLFTDDRPLLELIDSDTTFINPHTAKYYPGDRKQMLPYRKQKGIEVEAVQNQKIKLEKTAERGGLLTMPGVLAMNKGPVLRGTWILERVLGEHLPDPPANVGQVPNNKRGENLTFRQRFEQHRNNATCAVCHDKIDPLGFALEAYGNGGSYIRSPNYASMRGKVKKKDRDQPQPDPKRIDTSGRLPSGETFEDFQDLKQILVTSQRQRVIRNIVRRTMAYALCRKLKVYDRPTVEAIVGQLEDSNGTFHDLIHLIADSLPFQETVVTSD